MNRSQGTAITLPERGVFAHTSESIESLMKLISCLSRRMRGGQAPAVLSSNLRRWRWMRTDRNAFATHVDTHF